MVEGFKTSLYREQNQFTSLSDYLAARPWDLDGTIKNEYPVLFEMVYDQPAQRQDFISSLVRKVSPAWGYRYLANLLSNNVFNIVCTTNFDDLIQDACYRHSEDFRPLVYGHESIIDNIRLTSPEPKIIKLHGDFIYDNLKNTKSETQRLNKLIHNKLLQISHEMGLIVVGYGGNDSSVMDALSKILKNRKGFARGVYWCTLRKESLSDRALAMCQHDHFHVIEIDPFDNFMSSLHSSLDLELPKEVLDPIAAVSKRFRALVETVSSPTASDSPTIARDRQVLIGNLDAVARSAVPTPRQLVLFDDSESLAKPNSTLSADLLAHIEESRGNYSSAIDYLIKYFDQVQRMYVLGGAIVVATKAGASENLLANILSQIEQKEDLLRQDPFVLTSGVLSLMNVGKYEDAKRLLDMMSRASGDATPWTSRDSIMHYFNVLQMKRHMGENLPEEDILRLRGLSTNADIMTQLGSALLLDDVARAADLTLQALNLRIIDTTALSWPIFRFLENKLPSKHEVSHLLKEFGPSQRYPAATSGTGRKNVRVLPMRAS